MVNAMKHPVLKIFENVDKAVYEKTIQWWAGDVMDTFGNYLLDIYTESGAQSDREKEVTNEISDWFYGRETVESSAAYCMQCLNLLQNKSEWDKCFEDASPDSEREVAQMILSYIAGDVATEVINCMEILRTKANE